MQGPYILGIDFGTESVRVGIFDQIGQPVTFASQEYSLYHPRPGWAEQKPDEWWAALVRATRAVLEKSGVAKEEVVGRGADCTSCTVVPMDQKFDIVYKLCASTHGLTGDNFTKIERTGAIL